MQGVFIYDLLFIIYNFLLFYFISLYHFIYKPLHYIGIKRQVPGTISINAIFRFPIIHPQMFVSCYVSFALYTMPYILVKHCFLFYVFVFMYVLDNNKTSNQIKSNQIKSNQCMHAYTYKHIIHSLHDCITSTYIANFNYQ